MFKKLDQDKITDYKEDIDTLLVFAGLFSAVLTAFNIEAYKLLKQDPQDVSTCLLTLISGQLGSFSVTSGFTNTTIPVSASTCSSSFQAPSSAITINIAWFLSLVFSLITASFGILVKQWLRAYASMEAISPQERCRLRAYRNCGMTKWNVFALARVLPLILQIALGLFFLGLTEFLSQIHPTLGRAIKAVVIIWLTLYVSTTLAPLLPLNCPYETPLTQGVNQLFWSVFKYLKRKLHTVYLGLRPHGAFWNAVDDFLRLLDRLSDKMPSVPQAEKVRGDATMDAKVLVEADRIFMDDDYLEKVLCPSMHDVGPQQAFDCLKRVAAHRGDSHVYLDGNMTFYGFCSRGAGIMAKMLLRIAQRTFREEVRRPQISEWKDFAAMCASLLLAIRKSLSAPAVIPGLASVIDPMISANNDEDLEFLMSLMPFPLSGHVEPNEPLITSHKAFSNIVEFVSDSDASNSLLPICLELLYSAPDDIFMEQQDALSEALSSFHSRANGWHGAWQKKAGPCLQALDILRSRKPHYHVDNGLIDTLQAIKKGRPPID